MFVCHCACVTAGAHRGEKNILDAPVLGCCEWPDVGTFSRSNWSSSKLGVTNKNMQNAIGMCFQSGLNLMNTFHRWCNNIIPPGFTYRSRPFMNLLRRLHTTHKAKNQFFIYTGTLCDGYYCFFCYTLSLNITYPTSQTIRRLSLQYHDNRGEMIRKYSYQWTKSPIVFLTLHFQCTMAAYVKIAKERMRNTDYYANKQSRNKSAYPHFQVYTLNFSLKDEFLDKQLILLFPFLEENLELLSSKPPSNVSHTEFNCNLENREINFTFYNKYLSLVHVFQKETPHKRWIH